MSLEYLIGYRVFSVSVPLRGQKWTWALNLDGGVTIRHTANGPKPPEAVENSVLAVAKEDNGVMTLGFYSGNPPEEIYTLSEDKDSFVIEWPEGQQPGMIERGDPADDLPADPSDERVALGPTMLEEGE